MEEVIPQCGFAESFQQKGTLYRTSPAPCGGTLPKGEGISAPYCPISRNFWGSRGSPLQVTEKWTWGSRALSRRAVVPTVPIG